MPLNFRYSPLRAPDYTGAAAILESAGKSFGKATSAAQKVSTGIEDILKTNAQRAVDHQKRVMDADMAQLNLARDAAIQGGEASYNEWLQTGEAAALADLERASWIDKNDLTKANLEGQEKAKTRQGTLDDEYLTDLAQNMDVGVDEQVGLSKIFKEARAKGVEPGKYMDIFRTSLEQATQKNHDQQLNAATANIVHESNLSNINVHYDQLLAGAQANIGLDPNSLIRENVTNEDLLATFSTEDAPNMQKLSAEIARQTGEVPSNEMLMDMYIHGKRDYVGLDFLGIGEPNIDEIDAKKLIETFKAKESGQKLRTGHYLQAQQLIEADRRRALEAEKRAYQDFGQLQRTNSIERFRSGNAVQAATYGNTPQFDNALDNEIAKLIGEVQTTENTVAGVNAPGAQKFVELEEPAPPISNEARTTVFHADSPYMGKKDLKNVKKTEADLKAVLADSSSTGKENAQAETQLAQIEEQKTTQAQIKRAGEANYGDLSNVVDQQLRSASSELPVHFKNHAVIWMAKQNNQLLTLPEGEKESISRHLSNVIAGKRDLPKGFGRDLFKLSSELGSAREIYKRYIERGSTGSEVIDGVLDEWFQENIGNKLNPQQSTEVDFKAAAEAQLQNALKIQAEAQTPEDKRIADELVARTRAIAGK